MSLKYACGGAVLQIEKVHSEINGLRSMDAVSFVGCVDYCLDLKTRKGPKIRAIHHIVLHSLPILSQRKIPRNEEFPELSKEKRTVFKFVSTYLENVPKAMNVLL